MDKPDFASFSIGAYDHDMNVRVKICWDVPAEHCQEFETAMRVLGKFKQRVYFDSMNKGSAGETNV